MSKYFTVRFYGKSTFSSLRFSTLISEHMLEVAFSSTLSLLSLLSHPWFCYQLMAFAISRFLHLCYLSYYTVLNKLPSKMLSEATNFPTISRFSITLLTIQRNIIENMKKANSKSKIRATWEKSFYFKIQLNKYLSFYFNFAFKCERERNCSWLYNIILEII